MPCEGPSPSFLVKQRNLAGSTQACCGHSRPEEPSFTTRRVSAECSAARDLRQATWHDGPGSQRLRAGPCSMTHITFVVSRLAGMPTEVCVRAHMRFSDCVCGCVAFVCACTNAVHAHVLASCLVHLVSVPSQWVSMFVCRQNGAWAYGSASGCAREARSEDVV